jgi:hypothetical protein
MATDGVKIIDGDLAYDIYSIFMEMYDAGASLVEIKQAIEQPFDEEDGFDYEIYITVYALALWQIGQLTSDIITEVDEAIRRGAGVKVWTEEDSPKRGQKRQIELEKFRRKLTSVNPRIRKRRIYKIPKSFLLEEDTAFTFQLPSGKYCVTILLSIFCDKGKCTYYFIESTYSSNTKPHINDIRKGDVIVRSMHDTGSNYEYGFSITAVGTKDLRSFASNLEQIGEVRILSELKKVGTYGGARTFKSFCQQWENQELYTKNMDLLQIPLSTFL